MSKENLDTVINEKQTIKFAVDELGLDKPLPQIPTDVEYFINKQRGVGESTYSFGKALKEAFKIDNFFVSGSNSFFEKDTQERDLEYEITKDQFDIIETYPEYMRNHFLEAKNNDHFYILKKQADERLDVERELANYGWKGMAARVIAAAADPSAIALSIATGGYYAPLIYGGKIARIKRAIGVGALVGTENAIIESGLVALDPLKDDNDIRYALYGGFLLGGAFGGLSKAKFKDIDQAYNKMDLIARKSMDEIDYENLNTFASENGATINEAFARKRRLVQPKIENRYDFTVTSDSKAVSILDDDLDSISRTEKEWREGKKKLFGFVPIPRFSMSSSLNKSPDPEIQKLSQVLFPDPIVGSPNNTMLEFKEMSLKQISFNFNKTRDIAYYSFLKLNPELTKGFNTGKIETFQQIISDIIEFPELAKTYKHVTPEMIKHANYASAALDDALSIIGQSGREGWGDIAKKRLNKNYFPHVHSQGKLLEALDEYGIDQLYKVYSKALDSLRTELDPKVFDRMVKGVVRNISSPKYRGSEAFLSRIFQGTDEAGMRAFLDDLDLTKEQIDAISNRINKQNNIKLDPNARRRLPFDINLKTDVKSIKTGKVRSLSLKDLMDRNAERVISRYLNQIIGQAAMARFGGFKKINDYDNFISRFENRNSTNLAYTDLSDHVDILKVVGSSILGRQNPLEKVDPKSTKMRRIMRLVGDYNFLRLFGQVGFAQGAELYGALGEVGWKTALKTMPKLEDLTNRLVSGDMKLKDPLLRELDSYGVSLGQDKFMNSPTARLEHDGDMLMDDKSTLFNNVEIKSGQFKRWLSDFSFLNPMTMFSQVWSAKALSVKIVENIKYLKEIHGTTNIYDKLKLGDQVRYRQLTWTKNQFNNIAKNIDKHATIENGFVKSLGIDNWDVEARSSFLVGLNRWVDRVVQRTDLASMNKWFTKDFVKLIIQFRTFSLAAYEKQLLNGLYTLDQTRGKDFETYSRFISSMIGASTFAAAQIYINSFGMRDRKEYLKERLSAENLAKIGFLRSSWSTLIPGAAGTVYSLFSEDDLFGYGRNTELSSSFLSGIPSIDLVDNIFSASRILSKSITDPTYQPSQSEMRKALSIFVLHNAIGIKNVNNMLVDNFAK